MAEAYHKEALRKQRIIDKQHAALVRIAIVQLSGKKVEENFKIHFVENKTVVRVKFCMKIHITERMQQLEEAKRKETEERQKIQSTEKEKEKGRKREEYLKSMGRMRGVGNTNYTQMLEEQKKRISQSDLRHQERILRDHCLVMGRVNASFLA